MVFTVGGNYLKVHKEVLSGTKVFEKAFKVPMKEAEEGRFDILFELDIESNSEFEFQSHLILFFALYGANKLPEDEYTFMTSAGPLLVRALALAHYRVAELYVVERLNIMVSKYFNRLTVWKQTPDYLLRDDSYKLHLFEINDTYLAYKHSNIPTKHKKFLDRNFGMLIALHCPARAWGIFESQMDDELVHKVANASMHLNYCLTGGAPPPEGWERWFLTKEDLSLFRP